MACVTDGAFRAMSSWGLILANNLLHSPLVCAAVLLEQIVCVGLSGRLWVDLVQEHLDAEQDLLDRDGRLPAFLLIENAKTNGARRIHVGVE